MNYKAILYIIARIMFIEAVFMIPALVISALCGEEGAVRGFALTIPLLLCIGALSFLFDLPRRKLYSRDGFMTVGIAWIALSLFGALPFYFSGCIPSFTDCFFESVSGFTTTGATILTDIEALPAGLLYWRSFTLWLGGMGVLVFVMALSRMNKDSGQSMHLLRAESTGPRIGKLLPRMQNTAKMLYLIYSAITVLQLLLLLLGKVPLFDAIAISFGTAGTGGFSVKNDSLASYGVYAQTVTTVFMLLFSVGFNIYFLLLNREYLKAVKDEQLRVFLIIIGISTSCVAVNVMPYFSSACEAIHHSAFQVASIISTSGFATVDYDLWPQFSRCVLVALMVIGACAGSTGGGIKISRFILLIKSINVSIRRVLNPNSVQVIQISGEPVDDDTLRMFSGYISAYIVILALSTVMLSFEGFDFETTFIAALASLNNIGPGLGEAGPTMSYAAFSIPSKLIMSACMLIGRLEIFPILILLKPSAWR